MGFPSKLSVDQNNVAKVVSDDGEYVITITVERHGHKPITGEDAEKARTKTLPTMFIQRG